MSTATETRSTTRFNMEKVKLTLQNFSARMTKFSPILVAIFSILLMHGAYWSIINIYQSMCAPTSVGFLVSFFIFGSPAGELMFKLIVVTHDIYHVLWNQAMTNVLNIIYTKFPEKKVE